MSIRLVGAQGERQIDAENFGQSIQELENMLEPGTPVMFQTYRWNDLAMGGGRRTQRILFFSGGNIGGDGVFNIEKGTRNFVYATIDEKDPNKYRIVCQNQEALSHHKLHPPRNWTMDQYNEGTFSASAGVAWKSNHSSGTEEVIVGDILEGQFADAMHALRFGRDAVYFELHTFYSMQSYLVTEIGDKGIRGEQESQRENLTHRMACLRACMNLLNEAKKQRGEFGNYVTAKQVGYFKDGTQELRNKGHPVSGKDYFIQEELSPRRSVAFVKTGRGIKYGETYILPANERMDELVELAFSQEMVREHYPYGFQD